MIAGFTPTDARFYRQPEVRRVIRELAVDMQRGVFMREGGSEFFTVFQDQTFNCGVRAANLGKQMQPSLTARLHIAVGKETAKSFFYDWNLNPGEEKNFEQPCKSETWPKNGMQVVAELLSDGKVIDRVTHDLHAWIPKETKNFITITNGHFSLKGKRWKANGVNYMPSSGIAMQEVYYFEYWLDRGSYDPEVIERDLTRISDMGLNAVSIFVYYETMKAQHLLDFLRRCDAHKLHVNQSLRPGTPLNFNWAKMKELIEFYHMAENDNIFAYDLAWEPNFGGHDEQQNNFGEEWTQWVRKKYGTFDDAAKAWGAAPIFVEKKTNVLNVPTMHHLTQDGNWRWLVADYRQFLDEKLASAYGEARRLIRTIDPNHAVSFRMTETGNPTFNWDQVLAYDFYGLRDAVDIWEPEAYGRIGDAEKVKPGRFEHDYARLCDPSKPFMWAEMGETVWDKKAMQENNDRIAFEGPWCRNFYKMMEQSGDDGVFFWWYPGGYRFNERSDFGIINPDGTDRPFSRAIREEGPRFLKAGDPPKPDYTIAVDRDRDSRGIFGIYQAVKDEYWRAIDHGKTPRLVWKHKPAEGLAISNESVKITFPRDAMGISRARIFARQSNDWINVASWSPLFRIALPNGDSVTNWVFGAEAEPTQVDGHSVDLKQEAIDPKGIRWNVSLRVSLEDKKPLARLHYTWTPQSATEISSILGPNIYVGDGTFGDAKSWGLFPGLEYLYGAERSSNPRDFSEKLADRRTPNPSKVSIPLMAITLGSDSQSPLTNASKFFTPDSMKDFASIGKDNWAAMGLKTNISVGLMWDPQQKWDGEHAFPSPRFASPNFDEGKTNHRVALFLPSTPDFVAENKEQAKTPFAIAAGKRIQLDATIVVDQGTPIAVLRDWLDEHGGLPKPNNPARSFQQELDLCRTGFLKTMWNEQAQGWSHCIGWAPGIDSPGYCSLLWMDSQLSTDVGGRAASQARVDLAANRMLKEQGAGVFLSQNRCHIMQWEFPFLYGYLPEALQDFDGQIRQIIHSQQTNGAWVIALGKKPNEKALGIEGDSVLGTCANHAEALMRYARITGDREAQAAGERALAFMESFRVPRGAQGWECPVYEPDILAAGYAVRAYDEAFRVTGNDRWLQDAVYWAETGVPFIYLWSLPDRPMMLGATLPVFGSTFYTYTWLATPVQWNGLVYSYAVSHLADDLKQHVLSKTNSPLPIQLNFKPDDWKRVVQLITVSGEYQQFADGDKVGAYPDSISDFKIRNQPFLNPEDIMVNRLALEGEDPDIKTARIDHIIVSSGATIEGLKEMPNGIKFGLKFFVGQNSHSFMTGFRPTLILVNGKKLEESGTPMRRETGWWWDRVHRRAYFAIPHNSAEVKIEIKQQ
ncbi:MAG: beta-galactosidase [Limisphaerales bacterium]